MPPLSWRVHSATCSDKMRSCSICKALNVNHFSSERSQLRWFDHVSRMSLETLARQVLLAALTRKRPRVRPKTRWSGYTSDMGVVRIFSRRGPLGDFSKIFPGGSQKWWNFFFSHSKLRNQTFLLKILMSKWPWPPLPPPSDAPDLRPCFVPSWCRASRTVWDFCWPWRMSSPPMSTGPATFPEGADRRMNIRGSIHDNQVIFHIKPTSWFRFHCYKTHLSASNCLQ